MALDLDDDDIDTLKDGSPITEDNETDDDDDSVADRSPAIAPAAIADDSIGTSQAAPMGAPASSMNPEVTAYLAKLQAAQDQVKQNQLGTGLGVALNQLTHGLSRAPGEADTAPALALGKNDEAPVNNVLAQQKAIDTVVKQQQVQDYLKQKLAQQRVISDNTLAQRADSAAAAKQARLDGASDKADQKQTQNYNQTVALLEQMRGSPAASQAEKDIYAAQKANSLLKIAAPNGDLNQVNPQMSALLRNEVGKIATGGTPSMQELQGLDPGTLSGALSGVWQKFSNEPTPANAGAFLKEYRDYANGVSKDAQKVIQDRYGRVIDSRSDEFSPAQLKKLQDNYVNRFKSEVPEGTSGGAAAAAAPHGGKYPPGSSVVVAGKAYTVGPDGDTLAPQ